MVSHVTTTTNKTENSSLLSILVSPSPFLQPLAKISIFYVLKVIYLTECHMPLCCQKYILKEYT